MTQIMSHGFHACDSLEHITWFMGYDWLTVYCAVTLTSHLMKFMVYLTMSHRGCVTRGDESPELGL